MNTLTMGLLGTGELRRAKRTPKATHSVVIGAIGG